MKRRTIKETKWVDDWLIKLGTESWYEKVFDEWAKTNCERYKSTLRPTPAVFQQLLQMVEPIIKKEDKSSTILFNSFYNYCFTLAIRKSERNFKKMIKERKKLKAEK